VAGEHTLELLQGHLAQIAPGERLGPEGEVVAAVPAVAVGPLLALQVIEEALDVVGADEDGRDDPLLGRLPARREALGIPLEQRQLSQGLALASDIERYGISAAVAHPVDHEDGAAAGPLAGPVGSHVSSSRWPRRGAKAPAPRSLRIDYAERRTRPLTDAASVAENVV